MPTTNDTVAPLTVGPQPRPCPLCDPPRCPCCGRPLWVSPYLPALPQPLYPPLYPPPYVTYYATGGASC